MAVLIKGMKIPTEGYIDVRINCNGTASFAIAKNPYFKEVEAFPVPEPHGDLIDASEKIRVQMYNDEHEDFHMVEMTIDDLLSQSWVKAYAFPVIPASKEG